MPARSLVPTRSRALNFETVVHSVTNWRASPRCIGLLNEQTMSPPSVITTFSMTSTAAQIAVYLFDYITILTYGHALWPYAAMSVEIWKNPRELDPRSPDGTDIITAHD
ncbi:hypothetical protein AB1N83_000858 [Pleurotus pulmonarius]